jgi:hypothetical protein
MAMPAGADHQAAAKVIATIGCVGDDCMIQLLHIGQRVQTANSLQKHNYRYSGTVENKQTEAHCVE